MQKVAKASGANYSFHKETSSRFMDSGPQGPVVRNARSHPLLVFVVGEKKKSMDKILTISLPS